MLSEQTAELLQVVTDAGPAALVVVNEQGQMIFVNQRTAEWFGFTIQELLDQPVEILLPESLRKRHQAHRERYNRTPENRAMGAGMNLIGRHKSGAEFPVDISLHPLNLDGAPCVLAHIVHVEHRARRELLETRNQSARMLGILDNVVEGIITIDDHGIIESVNPASERIFQYAAHELVGQNIRMLMPSPYSESHDEYLRNYRESGERKVIGIGREAMGRRKDGTEFPIDLSVGEVQLHNRRVFTGVIRDITERKLIENELRRQRDFAERLIETTQAIVIVLTPDGRIERVNRFMEELTGCHQSEVRGEDCFTRFVPAEVRDWFRSEFDQALCDENVRELFCQLISGDGSIRQVAWWVRGLANADGLVHQVLCVGHDFTELNRAQQRAVQAERLAAIGQMVTGLAHESRNAIQRAQACQEMLALDVEDQPDLLDLTQRTQRALDDLHRLYEEVRGYAAPVSLHFELVNLRELWEQCWKDLEIVRRGRNVRLIEECAGSELVCEADPHRLLQVLRNILENALSASPDDGEIRICCSEANLNDKPAVSIALRDEGPGISQETAERIFEPFFTTKRKGTGLGMAIAKRIAEAHGGRIKVANPDQPGAEIVLTLPRAPS